MKTPLWKMLAPVAATLVLLVLPAPEGLSTQAWQYFSLFIGVVVALILEPVPAALSGLIGVVLAVVFRLVPQKAGAAVTTGSALSWGLSGFSNGTVWLIFVAFMFALGYERTGLGRRIALVLIKHLGKRTLGMGYAVALADLVLAPFIPSNTARSGGTIYPIAKNIPEIYGSTPDNEPRKMGSYLCWTALAATCVTSSMFITSLAPNLLALSIVDKVAGQHITWMEWLVGFLPVGVILFLLVPVLGYVLYPPTLKHSADIPRWAGEELAKLGPLSRRELTMALLAVAALLLWIFGEHIMNATTAGLVVLCLMALLGVVSWSDIIGNKQAWNVLVWFATLVTLAGGLGNVGFLAWFSAKAATAMEGFSPTTVVVLMTVLFFVTHYFFASVTAHVTALLPVFLSTAMAIPGVPLRTTIFMLCFSLGIMGIITPYGTGPSPIWYGSGYVPGRTFWLLGAVFGAIFLLALLLIGMPWLSIVQ
ncbi:anion transporter [Desulfovibrio sp. X2]|uniref:anion permease n=1 Tax=Desulfovibrio sp. X2 TaxID=941449 RepID=UPI000358A432|nr:anion permease [Desulfovibrio sp. X2]EPR39183.1 anion transporter [Desulfovibrio sp. X2]